MKKILLALLISFLNLSISTVGMEKEQSESGQIAGLPKELWAEIASVLSKSKDIREAVRNIQSLAQANRPLYRLLNDPVLKRNLINGIAEHFNVDIQKVEALLGMPEGKKYLDRLLAEFKRADPAVAIHKLQELFDEDDTIVLNYFFKNGMSPNKISQHINQSLLLLASNYPFNNLAKKWDLIKFLIEKGANINDRDPQFGHTLLFNQLRHLQLSAIMGTNQSQTQIKEAIEKITYLLDHGANVNLGSAIGSTPLLLAISLAKKNNEYINLVKLLLEKKAHIEERDFELAQNNSAIINLLNNYKNK